MRYRVGAQLLILLLTLTPFLMANSPSIIDFLYHIPEREIQFSSLFQIKYGMGDIVSSRSQSSSESASQHLKTYVELNIKIWRNSISKSWGFGKDGLPFCTSTFWFTVSNEGNKSAYDVAISVYIDKELISTATRYIYIRR